MELDQLPRVFFDAAPELVELDFPAEPLADCGACPMAGTFLADLKCCTYHPALPNYLVGRALERGDAGSDAVRQRLQDLEGVGSLGVRAPRAWAEGYQRDRATSFGRDPAWRCPYWQPGALNCSIWRDRNGICRTWFCKHGQGVHGHRLWTAVRKLVRHLEGRTAELAAEALPAVKHPSPATREQFYRATAAWVEQLDALPDDEDLPELRAKVREARAALDAGLPEVLAPLVRGVTDLGEEVELEGYTPWNTARYPRSVFVLLAACDGQRSWREAVAEAQQTDPAIDRSWVEELYRLDVLHPPTPGKEWGFEGEDLTL